MGNLPAMSENGMAEAIATAGLFLHLIAVIAVAVCVANWGSSNSAVAAVSGVVALLSFPASIACFRAQADEPDQQEVAAV